MARTLTATQSANVTTAVTRPLYLVHWQHSGSSEYLSCSGEASFETPTDASPAYAYQTYTPGGINIQRIEDSHIATLTLPATSTRVTEVQDGTWRGGICRIWCIPAAPVDTGSPINTYANSESILILDGLIDSSTFRGESISVQVKCKYFIGKRFPSLRLSDVATHIPPVGSAFSFDGEEYSYEQWLKTTAAIQVITNPGRNPVVHGRPTASQVNDFSEQTDRTGYKIISAEGVYLPIVYGRAAVPGYVILDVDNLAGEKIVAVAWCLGPVFQVKKVFVAEEEIPAGISVRHYLGTTWQTADESIADFIAGYDDDLVYHLPQGDIGVCYSVFNLGSSGLGGAPKFRAIIQGKLVEDPDAAGNSDPYYDYTQLSVDFTQSATDTSQNAHTVTLNGDAVINSPSIGLELDGTGDYASVADDATLEIGSSAFSLEIEAGVYSLVTSPETVETLISHHTTDSPGTKCLRIDRVNDQLLLYLSSDGLVWDIANGFNMGALDTYSSPIASPEIYEFRFLLERVGNIFFPYINGVEAGKIYIANASPVSSPVATGLFDSGAEWQIGAYNGTQGWTGYIKSVRLTIGAYRYGSAHVITNTPFSDSGEYSANLVYSDKPALAWKDMAENIFYGLGATTTGVSNAVAYGDALLSSGEPRCRIGIALTVNKRVEQYLDLLAHHANCIWFPEGGDLKIRPDRGASLGDELITNGSFE